MEIITLATFILSCANAFNLGQSKILLFGKELMNKTPYLIHFFICQLQMLSIATNLEAHVCCFVKTKRAIGKSPVGQAAGKVATVQINPLPDLSILGFSNSAANKDIMSKLWINWDTII